MRCPHSKIVEGRDVYGIFSHYHQDGSSCDVLNVIGFDVANILPFYAKKFRDTPEFRAAFIVSKKVRFDVYKAFSTLASDTLTPALLLLYKVVKGAYNESDIWGEAYDVFGSVFLTNMQYVTKTDLSWTGNLYTDTKISFPMVNLIAEKVDTHRSEAEKVVEDWKAAAEQAAYQAAVNKNWRK